MEKRKTNSTKKTIIILSSILIALVVAFTAITLAWFTDSENFNSAVEFGVVEIDTSSGASTQSALTKTVTRSIGELGEKVMPGDTINFNLRIHLTSTSEPAYYLVKVAGTGALSSLTSNYYYYVNGVASATVSKTATGNDRTCGAITATDTHTLTIPFVISIDLEEQGLSGNITCVIATIQQANITIGDGYDVLKDELEPLPPSVTLGTASLFPYIGHVWNAEELGFYHTVPAGYALDNEKTTALRSTVTGDDTTIISVYTNGSKVAIVSSGTIYAPINSKELFSPGGPEVASRTLHLAGLDVSNVTNVEGMFRYLGLTSLNLVGWDLSNVSNFSRMFASVNSSIIITCSQATKDIIMAHNGTGSGNVGITFTNANFNVV